MRFALFGLFLALVGCQSGALSSGVPGTSPQRAIWFNPPATGGAHLYVSFSPASNPNYVSVERFRLVNGMPQSKPDRVYNGHGGLIAVSRNGTLYASDPQGSSLNTVFAFDGGRTKLDRTISVRLPRQCGASSSSVTLISALATDPQGNLFVGVLTYGQDASLRANTTASPRASVRVPCNGVAIFAPNAKGQAKPIQSIDLGYLGNVNSLAVDSADNLFIGDYPTNIPEYANAIKQPKQTRLYHTLHAGWVSSLATDAAGDIFISNTNYQNAEIDRYTPAASQGQPTNEIALAGSGFHALLSIAARGGDLYADDKISSVDLYHARKNGPQRPFFSLAFPYVRSVAVGP